MRPIDAVQVLNDINWHHKPTPVSEFESGFNQGLNQAMWIITHAPTLTPPNEPLTIEQLREMDEPVWVACKTIEGGGRLLVPVPIWTHHYTSRNFFRGWRNPSLGVLPPPARETGGHQCLSR